MAIDPMQTTAVVSKGFPVVGVLCTEGSPTGDGRMIAANALRWTLPMPLRRVREDFGAHNGAVVVGAIEKVERLPSGDLAYSGTLFDTTDGRDCRDEMYARYQSAGLKYGISVDLDDVVVGEDDTTMVVEEARLRGATLCDVGAYASAYTMLTEQVPSAMVAAGSPRLDTPIAWFQNPRLTEPTPLTVTAEGRVYGHAATWKQCHIAYDRCVTAPRSRTNYAYFRTGLAPTAEGIDVPIGHITAGIGHAGPKLGAEMAAAHYDNVNSIICDVAAGEDEFGLWLAGTVRDGVTDEQVRELRAAAVSGDWRQIDGNLELVAMLSVAVPGFPVPRSRSLVASGEVQSLVASAAFDTEANVEENPVDVPEVAPEEVAAAVAEPVVEEMAEEPAVEDQPDAQDAENVDPAEVEEGDVYDARTEIEGLKAQLAEALLAIAALTPVPVAEDAPAEDVEPVEAIPAEEHSGADLLAALDAIVNGPQLADVAGLLAELDAKVGA